MRFRAGMTFITMILALVLVFAGCASIPQLSGTLTINGFLNVEPLAGKLAADFMRLNPAVKISVQGSSTTDGIKAANTGTADIGGASRTLKADEPGLVTHLLAKDGIAIIVHPGNTVKSLTTAQIRDLLSGKITNWSTVGGIDQPVQVITREAATSTRAVVEELIMFEAVISPGAVIKLSNEEQKSAVMENPQSIAYNPFASSLDGTVKALAVDGVEATKENAKNNTYPLVRPLYFMTKTEPVGLAKAFIDYCLGAIGQKLVSDLGYVPVR
jgi:phosphate transport system substrate-binding protein